MKPSELKKLLNPRVTFNHFEKPIITNQILKWENGFPEVIIDPSIPIGTIELRYGEKIVGKIINVTP